MEIKTGEFGGMWACHCYGNQLNEIKKGNQSLRKESEAKTQELRDPKTVNQALRTWAPKGVAGEEDESSWVC
ncbi:putative Multiprotein-bridging factor [Corchorus olitorius]|uniref:Multiprotein-bridging factor n=1 Tax=Corchorus olitorius TaxID=93759 RepID=A0A1R3JBQ9_9ROSI|nr:putative Multiprotein-bridging factor [Corchorus olitorius]